MAKPNLLPHILTALTILSFVISATSSALLNQEIDAVIEALLCPPNYEAAELPCRSDFTIWAKLLAASKNKHINLPVLKAATMFVPTDSAISHLRDAADVDPYLLLSHVTPDHLLFSDLYGLKPLSLLPTLVPSKTILITSTLRSSYKVDNAIITRPDIYVSSRIVVHGIDRVLDLNPQRSSMPPLLRVGNVLTPTISPVAAPAASPVAV